MGDTLSGVSLYPQNNIDLFYYMRRLRAECNKNDL